MCGGVADDEIQKLRTELAQCRARARELTDRVGELERQRQAAEAVAATGRMAAQIAHEINNPLAGIRNALLLIRDAVPVTHPDFPFVARIEKELSRITRIVRHIYDLKEPREHKPARFILDDCVRDVMALMEAMCRQKGVVCRTELPDPPLAVFLPEPALRQVLYNLARNAIDATPPGGTVTVAAGRERDQLIITVRDDGPGVPAELRERIFEPFFTTKGQQGGHAMGLGLPLSRSLVAAMGGRLVADSCSTGGAALHIIVRDRATQ